NPRPIACTPIGVAPDGGTPTPAHPAAERRNSNGGTPTNSSGSLTRCGRGDKVRVSPLEDSPMGRKKARAPGPPPKEAANDPGPKETVQDPAPAVTFPIVGIGASAGGLEAVTTLLQSLPRDTGMAFVVVQHLDPRHSSALTEILGKMTQMPVSEVRDGMEV